VNLNLANRLVFLAALVTLPPAALPSDLGDDISAYVEKEMYARSIPGAAVAVLKDGALIFKKAYGTANLETDTPVHDDSIFELASVTKPFTATAIMLLVQEGKINLDAPVTTYIEGPESWNTRTIRNLLTHTAGFPLSGIVNCGGSPLLTVTAKQALDYLKGLQMLFPAGALEEYSDAGYLLLGLVIERVSGETYGNFLRDKIFKPLHMDHTATEDRLAIVKNRVSVYSMQEKVLVNWGRDWRYDVPSFFGVLSTVDDLARWDDALAKGTLLDKTTLEQMWTPAKLTDGRVTHYGLGWEIGSWRGHRVVAHQGASGTLLMRYPDEGLTVIVLTNLGNPSDNDVWALARGISGIVNPELLPPHLMSPHADPRPETTTALRNLVLAVGRGEPSTLILPGALDSINGLPPKAKEWALARLRVIGPLTYLGADEPARGRAAGQEFKAVHTLYYRGPVDSGTAYLIFALSADERLVSFNFYVE